MKKGGPASTRERQRNRMAYDALLKENADIRHMYHERIGALKEEVRRLRRLRSRGRLARLPGPPPEPRPGWRRPSAGAGAARAG